MTDAAIASPPDHPDLSDDCHRLRQKNGCAARHPSDPGRTVP